MEDVVEIVLDGDNTKDVIAGANDRRILVNSRGELSVPDGRDSGITAAAHVTSSGYSVELAIPWTNVGAKPYEDMTIGFDVPRPR